ncbi:MAG: GatB/YqeY domain-containing protein [Rhodobacteraceae bacterium]|nr:GatB/YqeY domain-containing protein [Paracoccaceae bacterium]
MSLREQIGEAVKTAMKAKAAERVSILRLMNSALKDRDIVLRGEGAPEMTEADIVAVLSRMVKQRQESVRAFDDGGRVDLADKERAEIAVIEEFLPRQLTAAEVEAAVAAAIAATGAASIKDMGKVMAELKAHHTGQMDFGAVGPMVKARLG